MLLDHPNALDEDLLLFRDDLENLPRGTAMIASDNGDLVTFFDVEMRTIHLQDLRGKGDNLHEVFLAKLTGDRTKNARPTRIQIFVDNHDRVVVEA